MFEEELHTLFDTKEIVIELNAVHIEAFPSHHLDAMRSLTNPRFILLDEADFASPGQQQDARDVSERNIAKSNPWIVMISTPNAPEGLFECIEKESESTCLYRRLFLDYTYGLNKICTEDEIQAAKASPSFEREYNLKYLGLIGNVFHTKDIDAAIVKGKTALVCLLGGAITFLATLDPATKAEILALGQQYRPKQSLVRILSKKVLIKILILLISDGKRHVTPPIFKRLGTVLGNMGL